MASKAAGLAPPLQEMLQWGHPWPSSYMGVLGGFGGVSLLRLLAARCMLTYLLACLLAGWLAGLLACLLAFSVFFRAFLIIVWFFLAGEGDVATKTELCGKTAVTPPKWGQTTRSHLFCSAPKSGPGLSSERPVCSAHPKPVKALGAKLAAQREQIYGKNEDCAKSFTCSIHCKQRLSALSLSNLFKIQSSCRQVGRLHIPPVSAITGSLPWRDHEKLTNMSSHLFQNPCIARQWKQKKLEFQLNTPSVLKLIFHQSPKLSALKGICRCARRLIRAWLKQPKENGKLCGN